VERDEALLELTNALRDLTAWLSGKDIPHVIVGGVAVAFVGKPRITEDIDAVILAGELDPKSLLADAKAHGFLPRRTDAAEFALANRMLLLQHEDDGIGVDISLGWLPFEHEMIARATRARMENAEFPIPTPEDLIVMKTIAFRGKDVVDIESVLDAREPIDLKRVRRWVGMLAEALEEPEVTERLETLLAQRKQRLAKKPRKKK